MIKSDQTLKNALQLQLVIDIIQQVLTYLCFGFIFEYLRNVVSSSFPKYLGISFLLWDFFCTAPFLIEWDKNEKNVKK